MKKLQVGTLIFLLGNLGWITVLSAQVTRTDGFVDVNRGLPNSFVQEIPYMPDTYEGSFYQEEEWRIGNIELFEGTTLAQYLIRYDLEMQRLEIQLAKGVRVLDVSRIRSFDWLDPISGAKTTFLNGRELVFAGKPGETGLYEVLVAGEHMQLLARREIRIKEGNYNLQLDIGSRTPKLIQLESYCLVKEGIALAAPAPKREQMLFFRGKREAIEAYVRENHLKFKKRDDLMEIVAFYNSL